MQDGVDSIGAGRANSRQRENARIAPVRKKLLQLVLMPSLRSLPW